MHFKTVLVLTAFVAGAVAGPLNSRGSCARRCTESSKLKYEPGKTYSYDYSADTTTTMSGTIDEESRLHIKASVLVTVHSKCEMSMQLRGVTLEESDPKFPTSRQPSKNSNKFAEDMQKFSLRFSFQDGSIDDVCSSPEEKSWVLNLKRGILSTFQNSMEKLTQDQDVEEVDVAGRCLVKYKALGRSWGTYIVKKVKDLSKCEDRQSAHTSIQTDKYRHQSDIKSTPLMTGEQECEQSISYDRIQKAVCRETLIFRPFSNRENGAVSKATQTLTFNSETSGSFAGDDYEKMRTTLIFNHEFEGQTSRRKFQDAEESLRDLCSNSVNDIRKEVPHLFARFVYRMKALSHADIKSLLSRTNTVCKFNRKGKKYITDALPVVGTESAVKVMVELIQNKEVSDVEADYWFTSFAFMTKPDLNMLKHVLPALDNGRKQSVLGISSMVQTYCLADAACANKAEVRDIVNKLTGMLNRNCQASNEEQTQKILVALKGIGNAGHSDAAEAMLSACAKNANTNLEIRLAAVDAFRRQSCSTSRQELMSIFKDFQEEAELRIASYLALMKCPTPSIVLSIKQVLDSEEVNQVGSFVWTHLTNMQETTDPCKEDIKHLLSNVFLEKKFSTDARKFSRAYEGSIYSEKINTGVHVDSNVIFSPRSYLPRSAMFNLTVDLFGHSLNMFEIGGRVEGFEHIIESFFGTNGYFPDKNVKKFLSASRTRRSIYDNKIDEFKNLFQSRNKEFDTPHGSMYFKMFGNELMYGHFNGLDSLVKAAESKINWVQILEDLANNRDVEYTKSLMFLDATYMVPTTAGLALTLSVNGTSTLNLKLGGKLDVRNLLKKEIDINGHIKPSGAVEISAIMSVDAFYARTGLEMTATLHSSSAIDGKIQMKNGKVFTTQINVPHDKIEILDIQTNIYLIHQDERRVQAGIEEDRTSMEGCTGNTLATITGMKLCAVVQFPNASMKYESPYFPLTGPTKFAIYLQKTDLKLKSYKFDATFENAQDKKAALLSFDTPGSEVDREMTAEITLDKPNKAMSLRLRTPIKKVGITGKYNDKEENKKLEFSFTIDDVEKLALLAQLDTEKMTDSIRYTPLIELRTSGKKTMALKGYGVVQPSKRYVTYLTLQKLSKQLIEFKVDVSKQGDNRYNIDSKFDSYVLSTKVRGSVHKKARVTTTNMNIDYSILEARTETLKVGTKFQDMSVNTLKKFKLGLNVDSSAAPDYNTALNWETQIADGHFENTLKMSQGVRGRNQLDVTVQEIVSYSFVPGKNSIYTNFKVKIPTKRINYVWYLKHQNTDKYVKSRAFLKYASRKRVDLQVMALSVSKKSTGQVKFNYPGREMQLEGKVEEVANKRYEASMTAQWQRGKELTATAKYTDKSSDYDLNHALEVEIVHPERKIQYEGEVKYNRALYMTKNKITDGADIYMLNVEYVMAQKKFSAVTFIAGKKYTADASLRESGESTTGFIDIRLDRSRHIKGMASFDGLTQEWSKPIVGKVNLYWDAEKDLTQKVEFNSMFNPANNHMSASLYYPVRTLSASFKPSYRSSAGSVVSKSTAEFSWERSKKITVELDLVSNNYAADMTVTMTGRTPFRGYTEMSVKHTHSLRSNDIMTKTSFSGIANNFLNVDLTGSMQTGRSSNYNTDLKIRSSIPYYENVGFTLNYNQSPRQFRTNTSVSWGNYQTITFQSNGADKSDYYKTEILGDFDLKTPFEGYRAVSGNMFHKYQRNQITSNGNFKWAPGQAISIDFGGSQMKTGKKNICKSTVSINTPFEYYNRITTSVDYEFDGQKMKTDVQVEYPRTTLNFGVDGSYVYNSYSVKSEMNAYFRSPFPGFEDLRLSTDVDSRQSKLKGKAMLKLHPRKRYAIASETTYQSWDNFQVEGNVNTPIYGYEKMEAKLTHKKTDSQIVTYVEGMLNEKKSSVDLSMKYENYRRTSLTWKIICVTPVEGYKNVVLSGRHQFQRGSVTNNLKYREIVLDQNLRYSDKMNFQNSIRLTHTYEDYPQLTLESSQIFQQAQKMHKTVLSTDNSKFWKAEAEYKSEQQGMRHDIKLDIADHNGAILLVDTSYAAERDMITPSIHVTWRNDYRTENVYVVGTWGIYQTAKRSGQIRVTSSFKNYESMAVKVDYDAETVAKSARISFTRPDEKVISLSGKIDTFRKSGVLSFNSPFEYYEELTLEGSYAYGRSMRGDIGFQWAPTKKIELSGTLMRTDDEGAVTVTLSTPFESYEKLIFSSNYDTSKDTKTMTTSLEYGQNERITFTGNGRRSDVSGYMKLTFSSPFEKYSFLSAETNFDVSQDKKTARINVEWPSYKKLYIDGELDLQEYKKSARLTINTPIEDLKSLLLTAVLDSSRGALVGNIKSTWNTYNTMELSGNFQKRVDRMLKGMLTFSSPFENFKNLKFELGMEKSTEQYKGSTSFSWNDGNRMSTDITLKTNPFSVVVRADSPFEPVKDVVFKANYKNADILQMTTSLNWMTTKKFQIVFKNQKPNRNEVKTSLVVRTPWEGYRKFELESSYMISKSSITAGFSAKTPFSSLPSLEMDWTLVREGTDKINHSFRINTDKTIAETSFDYNYRGQREEAKFYFKIPLLYKNAITADFTRYGNQRTININNVESTYTLSYKLINNEQQKQVSIELLMPSMNNDYREMKLDGSMVFKSTEDVDAMVSFQNVVDTHKIKVSLTRGESSIRSQIDITTPLIPTGHVRLNVECEHGYTKKLDVRMKIRHAVYSVNGAINAMTSDQFDAKLSVDTPIDFFGNAMAEVYFKKQEYQSLQGSFKLETPFEQFRSLKANGNVNSNDGTIHAILSLEAPIPNFEKIELDSKLVHDAEWRDVRPSITLSTPSNKFGVFAEYVDRYQRRGRDLHRSAKIGLSKNSLVLGELRTDVKIEKDQYKVLTILKRQTFDYQMVQYKVEAMYRVQDGGIDIDGSIDMPDNRVAMNGRLYYQTSNDFNFRVSATSSFADYESFSASVTRRATSYNCRNEISASWSQNKIVKAVFTTNTDRQGSNVKLDVQTPWEIAREISSSYNQKTVRSKRTYDFDVKYLRNTVVEISTSCDKTTRTLAVEVPKIGLKASSMFKSEESSELTFKIEIPSRIVFFSTVYESTRKGFKHTTEFAWDQRKGSQGSLGITYTDKSTRHASQGDLVIRLVHSIRAVEVMFSHQVTERDASLTTKFMWDPLRDTRKQMTIKIEGHDVSVYGKNSYNGIITFKTPRLYNDIKIMGSVDTSSKHREMLKANLKLDYSGGDRRKGLEYEVKLTDDTRRRNGEGTSYTLTSRLLHPASVTYVNMVSKFVLNDQTSKIETRFSYVDRFSARKSYMLRSILNQKKLTLQMTAPSKNYLIVGNVESSSAQLTMNVDRKSALLAQVSYKTDPEMIAQADVIYYPTNDGLKIRAFAGNAVSIELNHKDSGRDFSDFLFTLAMAKPRILKTKVNWRTTMFSELKNEIKKQYWNQMQIAEANLKEFMENAKTEISNKIANIKRVNSIELKPFFDDLKALKNDMYADYLVLKRQAMIMYRNNEFYVQNIHRALTYAAKCISETFDKVVVYMQQKWECIKSCISGIISFIIDTLEFICDKLEYYMYEILWACQRAYYYLRDLLRELCDCICRKIQAGVAYVMARCSDVATYMMVKASEFIEDYLPFVKTIADWIDDVTEYLNEKMNRFYASKTYILLSKYYQAIGEFVQEVYEIQLIDLLYTHYQRTLNKISDKYSSAKDVFNRYYAVVLQHPHIALANDMANHGYQKIAWAYRFWGIEESLNNIYSEWYVIVSTLMTEVAHDMTSKYTEFIQESNFIYEPSMGKIELDIGLPSNRDNLKHLLDFGSSPEYQSLVAMKEKYMPENRLTVSDYWYLYKPHSDVSNWVPPFKTEAMLAGKQHYMTFDKLFYNFAGECSYLLAQDLLDGNFSVIVNYEKKQNDVVKKSIVVNVDGKKIEVTPTFKVSIDDRKTELPQQFDNTVLSRFDDTITISNSKGITVKCNFYRDVCTVDIAGWYFGKTGGLYGKYDNEPQLDMQKPDGKRTTSLNEFASSWAVGSGRCREENYARRARSNSYAVQKTCKDVFEAEYSPLRPCFKVVETEEFMDMCLIDVENRNTYGTAEEATCTAAYAYKQRCLAEGIEVLLPSSCGRCKNGNGMMEQGDIVTINENNKPSAADVVFIVEEKACNKDKFKIFEEITQSMERSLRDKSIGKVTYSVVAYGGDGVHDLPHLHYAESQESGTYRSVVSAFNTLTVGNGNTDVYEAIRFATNLRFTPGAAKTFILAKCSVCDNKDIKENYGDILRMLVDQGISLHVLMDNDFKLRTGSRKSSGIYGIDKFEAFTSKDARDRVLEGDRDLRAQIYDVKDFCVPLAFETNGTLFNSLRLTDTRRNVQKNFVHVFSNRVAKTTEASNCQICTCHGNDNSSGKIQCYTCISPFDIGLFSPNLPDFTSWPGNSDQARRRYA